MIEITLLASTRLNGWLVELVELDVHCNKLITETSPKSTMPRPLLQDLFQFTPASSEPGSLQTCVGLYEFISLIISSIP